MRNISKTISFILVFNILNLCAEVAESDKPNQKNASTQDLKVPEKLVTFYNSYGYELDDNWHIPLRVWISGDMDWARRMSLKGARKAIRHQAGVEQLSDTEKKRFKFRAEDFFRDSESDEVISIQFDNDPVKQIYKIADSEGNLETDRNGNIEGTVVISKKKAMELLKHQNLLNGWLSFHVVAENQFGKGLTRLVSAKGLSIISDIDDTIKVTEIPSGTKTVLNNTFFKPFAATPNMLEMYRSFSDETSFHYVSGGPWQLHSGLTDFMFKESVGFPNGSLHMKNVRTNLTESESYQDFIKLIAGRATVEQKFQQIAQIFSHFPQREFILIGDSGEHDPEIFNTIKKRFPKQVKEIRIRDIVNDAKLDPNRLKDMIVISTKNAKG